MRKKVSIQTLLNITWPLNTNSKTFSCLKVFIFRLAMYIYVFIEGIYVFVHGGPLTPMQQGQVKVLELLVTW